MDQSFWEESRNCIIKNSPICMYRGADKSLDRPGRKEATETEDFDFHMSNLQRDSKRWTQFPASIFPEASPSF